MFRIINNSLNVKLKKIEDRVECVSNYQNGTQKN